MDDNDTQRVITPMPKLLLEAIDRWRYASHIPSRAEAIRRLIEHGLEVSLLPSDVSAEIDAYRSGQRIPSRAAAVSRLIEAGLKSEREYFANLSKQG